MKEKKRNLTAVLLAIAVAGTIIATDIHISRKAAKPHSTTVYKVIERDTDAVVSYRYTVTEPTEKK